MTPEVARFLHAMLLQQSISVSQPDMVAIADLAAQALTQLTDIMEGTPHG